MSDDSEALKQSVLKLLKDGAKMTALELITAINQSGSCNANFGNMYPLLARMERDFLVFKRQVEGPRPRRNTYEITPNGRLTLKPE